MYWVSNENRYNFVKFFVGKQKKKNLKILKEKMFQTKDIHKDIH